MTRIKISYLFTFLSKCKQTELQQQQHLKTRQKITKNVLLALVHKKSITSLVHCFFYKKMSQNLTNKKTNTMLRRNGPVAKFAAANVSVRFHSCPAFVDN